MSETYIVIVFVPIPTPLTAWRGDPKGASHVFGPTLATRAWIGNTCSPFLFSYLPVKTLAKSLAAPPRPPPGAAPSRYDAPPGGKASATATGRMGRNRPPVASRARRLPAPQSGGPRNIRPVARGQGGRSHRGRTPGPQPPGQRA